MTRPPRRAGKYARVKLGRILGDNGIDKLSIARTTERGRMSSIDVDRGQELCRPTQKGWIGDREFTSLGLLSLAFRRKRNGNVRL